MQEAAPLTLLLYKLRSWVAAKTSQAAKSTTFRRVYVIVAVLVLLLTSLLWAVLGARLQTHNADQLSDPYMFSNWRTFHGGYFPGAHTFLIKWPIFWLVNIWGISKSSLTVATVSVVLLTMLALLVILYKIDRRPLIFSTLCLGLSLTLLLVPAQSYAGGLLPVNMAMLTTRNLEYAFYIIALSLLARARTVTSRGFMVAVTLLALLIASDKLFMSLSLGGAALAVAVYTLVRNREMVVFAWRWLLAGVIASGLALVLLFAVSLSHLTHLTNASAATPYTLSGVKGLAIGVSYALAGVFTNAGANPAYDVTILSKLPGEFIQRLWSFSGAVYVVATIMLLCACVAVWRTLIPTIKPNANSSKLPTANLLAVSLLWSTLAACGVFVATNHYYAVDARYLTIGFFTLAVSAAVWLRSARQLRPERLLAVGCLLLVATTGASVVSVRISHRQTVALSGITRRNELVSAALKRHKVSVLVGDYWRVLPIKLASGGRVAVSPLSDCTHPAHILTSDAWQPDLTRRSFAYLVTLSGSLTNFPDCSLAQITAKFGSPNSTQIIAGTPAKPDEALLFYDAGSRPNLVKTATHAIASLLPIKVTDLTKTGCSQPTILNIVAHEDDDLLFLSPDLLHELHDGDCVRTIFMTAGDAGSGKFYWLSRRLGSEAAYSSMLGIQNVWNEQTVQLGQAAYATIATPHESAQVSLVFLNLPDGDLRGQGFPASDDESLAKLYDGAISTVRTVDGQSHYTYDELVHSLVAFMSAYRPSAIHTQADAPSEQYPDHSDHITTGKITTLAAAQYSEQYLSGAAAIPLTRYIGYPVHGYDPNVSAPDLEQKEAAFLAYAHYDRGVCQSFGQCAETPTYGSYLTRQYVEDSAEQ